MRLTMVKRRHKTTYNKLNLEYKLYVTTEQFQSELQSIWTPSGAFIKIC